MIRPAWHDDARCAEVDGDIWYPEKGGSNRDAKAICRACPVRVACAEDAIDRHEEHGVWGGLSVRERKRVRAGRGKTADQYGRAA